MNCQRIPDARRAGFTLVEVIISTTLLAVVMIMVATLATSVGRRGRLNELTTKRNLALAQEAGRIQAMTWNDVLLLSSGTTQMLVGDFTFNRRFVVTDMGSSRRSIRIIIEPVAGEFRPDSVTFDRTRPASGSPMCTTC